MHLPLSALTQAIDHLKLHNINPDSDLTITSIHHDTRALQPGALYLPIQGESFDGHQFIPAAFEAGAVISLCHTDQIEQFAHLGKPLIEVVDMRVALAQAIKVRRDLITTPIIAITGSTGKSTTRELIAAVLEQGGSVLKTEGNLNTLWGNALVLNDYTDQDYTVLEVGMDSLKEIEWQCQGLTPDIGGLISIGSVHAANVGGVQGVYETKKELATYCHDADKPMIYNTDDPKVALIYAELNDANAYSVGSSPDAHLSFSNLTLTPTGTSFTLHHADESVEINLKLLGKGYVYNAMIAVMVGLLNGLTMSQIKTGLESSKPPSKRFELQNLTPNLTLIQDAYNANPTSMRMSLETFNEIYDSASTTKIAIIGDMKELGEVEESEHREINELLKTLDISKIYYIGKLSHLFENIEQIESPEQAIEIIEALKSSEKPHAVLLKASHGVGLWKVS